MISQDLVPKLRKRGKGEEQGRKGALSSRAIVPDANDPFVDTATSQTVNGSDVASLR